MNIGFLGLGQMGLGMATNLLRAGHAVVGWNRSPEKSRALAAHGARIARDAADACNADAIVTMLADDAALEQISAGDRGIFASLPRGALHVCCGTHGLAPMRRLAREHAARGQRFVSAPVFGRPEAATAAKLNIVAAGAEDALTAAEPIFKAIGQRTFKVGSDAAAANLVKLSGNFLIAAVIESLGEAFALVGKGGVAPAALLEVMTATLFDAPVYRTYGKLLVEERFEPAGFAAPLGAKDVRLVLAAGEELRVPLPLAALVRDRLLRLMAERGESIDWSAFGTLAARDAGIPSASSATRA